MAATLVSAVGFQAGTVSIDPGPILGGARGTGVGTIAGLAVGDLLQLEAPSTLNNSLIFEGFVITANTVTVFLKNPTGTTIDDAARTWTFVWVDRTPSTEILGHDPS